MRYHYDGLSVQAIVCRRTEHAKHVKGAKVSEALPELKQSAAKLEPLIESNKYRLNVQALDMAQWLPEQQRQPTFTSRMVEGFFDRFLVNITEMIGNNNPSFLEFARLVSRKSFHYLISTITSLGASGISIRRI